MKTQPARLIAALALLALSTLNPQLSIAFAQGTAFTDQAGSHNLANLPVCFEANVGQADPAIKFLVHGCEANLQLTRSEAWLHLRTRGTGKGPSPALRLGLAGASPTPELAGVNPLAGRMNYFIGNRPGGWHTQVPVFAQVKYQEVYPGVDLIYHGNQQRLECDFVVQPGADPNRIALEVGGAGKASIESDGDLLLPLPEGGVRLCKPVVYQEISGARNSIPGNFVIRSAGQVGFQVGEYDRSRPLIIDPVLAYSFPFGANGGPSQGLGIALDTNDNVYITGNTMAANYPLAGAYQTNFTGSQDVFISEFDTNGALVFSTFLGGDGAQSGQGITVGFNGNIFITGYTSATNFPTKNPLQATNGGGYDAFVTELSSGGKSLIFSTYLGGAGFDAANAITLDTNYSPIVTGYTQSTNFPTANAAQPMYGGNGDAFITKLNPGGSSLVYSTYLGGNDSEDNGASSDIDPVANLGDVLAHLGGAITVDLSGNAYVTGWTYSTNFPVLNAYQPTNLVYSPGSYTTPFVTKLDPSGNPVYSTYFGGGFSDFSRAIGVDFSNNVYIAGSWYSYDLPTTNAFDSGFAGSYSYTDMNNPPGDGFIAALDATGTNLIWCTYLGGSGDDQINGMAVRPDGAVAVTGWTDSPNFPVTDPTQGPTEQGCFKSTTGGNAWSASPAGFFPISTINVNPLNPANIYLINRGGLFQSTNSGANWAEINFSIYSPAVGGASQNLIAFDPVHQGVAYAGAYSGVFKTTDNGATWTTLTNGLPPSPQIQALAVDPHVPSTIYAGTYTGIGGLYQSTNAGTNWAALNTGLPSYVAVTALLVDPLNSSNVYAGLYFDFFASALYKSTDGGNTWNGINALPSFGQGTMAIAADPVSPTNLYVLLGGGESSAALCRTTDGGTTWSNLLTATNQNLTTFAVAPPAVPTLAIVPSGTNLSLSWPASFTGYALQTTPRLVPAQWTNVTQAAQVSGGNYMATLPRSAAEGFYRLAYTNQAPLQPTLYVGTDQAGGQGAMRSTDGGNTWDAIGLTGQTVNALAADPANPNTVYAGLAGSYDAFVTTLIPPSPYRVPYFSTYLGGSGADYGNAIAMDFNTVFVTGSTLSPDFPTTGVAHLRPEPRDTMPPVPNPFKGTMFEGFLADIEPCPTNSVYNIVATNNVFQYIRVFSSPYRAKITRSGPHPQGVLDTSGSVLEDGEYKADITSISGTPTEIGTTTWYYTFTDGACTWTYTINFMVVNP